MPSVSKKQQKFMGIVRSIQKGEQPAGKFSKAAQDAAKKMKKSSVKKYAKTKHDDLPNKVKEDRDYKDEYKKFQSSPKAKKYRAELNKYNRQKGTYGNGDGKDASHKGGKIVGFESQSKNRGRAEKSRLKKEINDYVGNILEDLCLCEACQKGYMTHPTRKTKVMFGKRYRNCIKKEDVNEAVYKLKRGSTRDDLDELDALMARAGFKGKPDFNKMTWSIKNKNPKIAKIIKSKGGKKIREGTCGYGIDGKIGEEPAGPNLMKKIKKISKDKEKKKLLKSKIKEDVEMSKGVKKLMKIADEGFGKVGGTTVDSMSAGLFKQIYNKVNDDIKKKLNTKNEKQLVRIIGGMWKKFGKNVKIGSSL